VLRPRLTRQQGHDRSDIVSLPNLKFANATKFKCTPEQASPASSSSGRRPLHSQLEATLLDRIEHGEWRAGDLFPTEAAIADAYGLSRNTVRQATSALERRGLLERYAGRGSFVRDPHFTYLLGWRTELDDEFTAQGIAPSVAILDCVETPATAADTRDLGVSLGSVVLRVRRLLQMGGTPAAILDHRMPREVAPPFSQRDLERIEIAEALIVAGVPVRHGSVLVSAGGADEQEAELLDIAPGTPVFRYERTLTLPDGRVAERDESVLRADRGRFRAEFMIPNSDAGGP
jgi:GntR family transcriptional regulator